MPVYGTLPWRPPGGAQAKDFGTGNDRFPYSSHSKPFNQDLRPPDAFRFGERYPALHSLLEKDEPDDFPFPPRRRFPWLKASVITIVGLLLAADLFMAVLEFHRKPAGSGTRDATGAVPAAVFKAPAPAMEAHTSPDASPHEATPAPETTATPDTTVTSDTRGTETPAADASLKPSETPAGLSDTAHPAQDALQPVKLPDEAATASTTDSGLTRASQPVPQAPAPPAESLPPQRPADTAAASSCAPAQQALGLCGWQANGAGTPSK